MRQWDFLDRLGQTNTLEELRVVTGDFARASGFQHHGYAMRSQQSIAGQSSDYFYYQDFRNEWAASYLSLSRPDFEKNDPRIQLARAGLPAGAWNYRGQFSYPPPLSNHPIMRQSKPLLRRAGEFGLRSGITVPSFAPGLKWAFMTFTLDHAEDPRAMSAAIVSSMYFVSCLQVRIDRMMRPGTATPLLSARELEVLRWCATGKTSWEISMILQISERTVHFHTTQAARKLQVKGRQAACARAVALDLIVL